MKVEVLNKVGKREVDDLNLLMSQLRQGEKFQGTLSEVRAILKDKTAVVLAVKDGRRIVGVATLYILQKIGKRTAHVEDVVIDSEYRGQGLGKKLMQSLLAVARAKKVGTVHLTSRPEKIAANKLYQKLGFKIKKTNPYTIHL